MNPTMIFANLLGQIINEILPSGIVLISLGLFVVSGIIINVFHCVKKFKAESKLFKEEKKLKKEKENFVKLSQKSVKDNKIEENVHVFENIKDQNNDEIKLLEKENELKEENESETQKIKMNNPDDAKKSVSNGEEVDIQSPINSKDQDPESRPIISSSSNLMKYNSINKKESNEKGLFSIESIKKYENRHLHPVKSPLFILTLLVVILNSFMKGTSSYESILGLEKCAWQQFLILALTCCILTLIFGISVWFVNKEQKVKLLNKNHKPHELLFSSGKIVLLAVSGLLIGFVSNILGIGGAIAMFPMFTCLGIDPFVASSSVMFMILLSKTVASVLAINSGFLNYGYVGMTGVITVISILLMLKVLDYFLKKFRRQSVIIMAMVLVLIFSMVFIPYYAIKQSSKSDQFWQFTSYCGND